MRKVLSFIMAVIMIISVCTVLVYAEDYPQMQVEVRAKSALLMEASTGRVLMAQNADERLYPASVTKIMSMLLVVEALENGKIQLTDVVTASANASKKGGSQIWLKDGEQMTVDELLKATAVASANDACTALGEYIAGSDDAFVKLMNDRAKQLGMNNTNFDNCTGLDDTADSHYTTAYDIALMSRELLKHDLIRNYSTVWMDTLRNGETQLVNTNKLIKSYDGATGLKTGTTSKAGCCVSASAERDGLELIAVVMGSDNSNDRFNSARAMLDWGFANYSAVTLSADASLITDVNVING
ncbi:MAG TPA: D-alanyl-D-alanine carboxypeptidase, partial [Ruminococcaceae bacterium]|nr:D-alanyl-D-alanine carboxypeptidase [Oscillospiraceae bacterium]